VRSLTDLRLPSALWWSMQRGSGGRARGALPQGPVGDRRGLSTRSRACSGQVSCRNACKRRKPLQIWWIVIHVVMTHEGSGRQRPEHYGLQMGALNDEVANPHGRFCPVATSYRVPNRARTQLLVSGIQRSPWLEEPGDGRGGDDGWADALCEWSGNGCSPRVAPRRSPILRCSGLIRLSTRGAKGPSLC
jgi:hypothetical protein